MTNEGILSICNLVLKKYQSEANKVALLPKPVLFIPSQISRHFRYIHAKGLNSQLNTKIDNLQTNPLSLFRRSVESANAWRGEA